MPPLIPHNHLIDKLAFLNGLISGVALYPQVFAILMNGHTDGISLVSFVLIFLNSCVWFLYAIHRLLISLMLSSILNMIASSILVLAILFQ